MVYCQAGRLLERRRYKVKSVGAAFMRQEAFIRERASQIIYGTRSRDTWSRDCHVIDTWSRGNPLQLLYLML